MAKAGYQVTLGEDPVFYAANNGKQAFTRVRLAENTWSYDQTSGEFTRGETNWYTGQFFGKGAESLHENFQKGDRLIVLGTVVEETVERDGREYMNRLLRVDTFGADQKHMTVQVDRSATMTVAAAHTVAPEAALKTERVHMSEAAMVNDAMAQPVGFASNHAPDQFQNGDSYSGAGLDQMMQQGIGRSPAM